MSGKGLKALSHMGAKEYKAEYESCFNDTDPVFLPA